MATSEPSQTPGASLPPPTRRKESAPEGGGGPAPPGTLLLLGVGLFLVGGLALRGQHRDMLRVGELPTQPGLTSGPAPTNGIAVLPAATPAPTPFPSARPAEREIGIRRLTVANVEGPGPLAAGTSCDLYVGYYTRREARCSLTLLCGQRPYYVGRLDSDQRCVTEHRGPERADAIPAEGAHWPSFRWDFPRVHLADRDARGAWSIELVEEQEVAAR